MFCAKFQNRGVLLKFSGSLAGCCITESLSHTTYVETNELGNTTDLDIPDV